MRTRLVRPRTSKAAIHNHGPKDKVYPTPYEPYTLIEKRDPRMGLCVDIGHTARAGKDIVRTVMDLKTRVLDVHLKDLENAKDGAPARPSADAASSTSLGCSAR